MPNPLDTAHATYLLTRNPNPLYSAIIDAAYRIAARKCPHDIAEDIAQRTVTACWIKLAEYPLRAKYSTWVASIVRNQIAHHYTHVAPSVDGLPVTSQLHHHHDVAPHTPASTTLPTLTEDERLLLHLRTERYTYAEIGEIIGESEANSRQLVRRCRKRLNACHVSTSNQPLICRDEKSGASRPEMPVQPISLRMGPDVIEQYADGNPAIVPIVDGWQPSYRITYGVIPDQDYVYTP